ncbi:hypothetical protein BC938DRAFT_476072, partial [Jimgerdemannia flammicorona]
MCSTSIWRWILLHDFEQFCQLDGTQILSIIWSCNFCEPYHVSLLSSIMASTLYYGGYFIVVL